MSLQEVYRARASAAALPSLHWSVIVGGRDEAPRCGCGMTLAWGERVCGDCRGVDDLLRARARRTVRLVPTGPAPSVA